MNNSELVKFINDRLDAILERPGMFSVGLESLEHQVLEYIELRQVIIDGKIDRQFHKINEIWKQYATGTYMKVLGPEPVWRYVENNINGDKMREFASILKSFNDNFKEIYALYL